MKSPLSPAEERVVRLRATGMPARAVAHELGISEQTVKNHTSAIFEKLDVDNIVSALAVLGWIRVPNTPPPPEYLTCDFIAGCGRRAGHRGQHGGFRAVAVS